MSFLITIEIAIFLFNFSFAYVSFTYFNIKIKTIPIDNPLYYVSFGIIFIYLLLTVQLCYIISTRRKSIDKALGLISNTNEKKVLKRRLKVIFKIFCKLDDLIDSVNKFLSFNIIFLYLSIFIFFISVPFLGYDILVHNLGIDDITFFFIGVVYLSINIIPCLIIINYSNRFDTTSVNFTKILINIQMRDFDKKIKRICFIGNLQMSFLRKNFSCGVIDINWKLAFSLIASIFSYLVTMIQFDYMLTIRSKELNYNGTGELFFN